LIARGHLAGEPPQRRGAPRLSRAPAAAREAREPLTAARFTPAEDAAVAIKDGCDRGPQSGKLFFAEIFGVSHIPEHLLVMCTH